MKNLKLTIVTTALLVSSFAQAEMSYKWVQLTKDQNDLVINNCNHQLRIEDDSQNLMLSYGGLTLAAGAGAGVTMSAEGFEANVVPGAVSFAVVGAALGGAGVYQLVNNHFTKNEILALIAEQQSHFSGLETQKLEQVSYENGLNADGVLATINAHAIRGQLCSHELNQRLDEMLRLETPAQEQARIERAQKEGAEFEAHLKQEEEKRRTDEEAARFAARQKEAAIQQQESQITKQFGK